ncbi:MAG: hypothetical protein OEY09_12525 [Gammaproteobacteria bacterium]|nr:hypothetical protein [Gammaproteobacteria bacterium]
MGYVTAVVHAVKDIDLAQRISVELQAAMITAGHDLPGYFPDDESP